MKVKFRRHPAYYGRRSSKVQVNGDSCRVRVRVNSGGVGMDYKGNRPGKHTFNILMPIFGVLALLGLGAYFSSNTKEKKRTNNTIRKEQAESGNRIQEGHEASTDRMAEEDNRTDNRIREAKEMSTLRMQERAQLKNLTTAEKDSISAAGKPKLTLGGWIEYFRSRFKMPDYSEIPILSSILDGAPKGFEIPILLGLLTEFGALCFSRVRATYCDGKLHSPSLQTVVEGEHGSGKGKFVQIHECLFDRIIAKDKQKLAANGGQDSIIQTAGITISQAKFCDVVANNQDVHINAVETEISTVYDAFKKQGGLSFEILRKAFTNEAITQMNKAKGAAVGTFNVFFNYIFTGTPKAISKIIDESEVEGGTASRICFTVLPEVSVMAPQMTLPAGSELDAIRDQIDLWREKYCYTTDTNGKDVACPLTTVNLDYVCDALKDWQIDQYHKSGEDGSEERSKDRLRIATIAFHCAIVLHMLAGDPKPNDRKLRRTVKEMAVFIADYCMERYIFKFSTTTKVWETPEQGNTRPADRENRRLTEEEILEWYPLHGTKGEKGSEIGYGYIARKLNVEKSNVVNSFKAYERKMQQ